MQYVNDELMADEQASMALNLTKIAKESKDKKISVENWNLIVNLQ